MSSSLFIEDTICALATPSGYGGISVVRVSGDGACAILRRACPFLPLEMTSQRVYFGFFLGKDGVPLDQVLVTYFKKGKSYTGEPVMEISCHGNPVIVKEILTALVFFGARLANRGEFTYRAFLNGKLDLIQAENVLSLIHAESPKAIQQSLNQLQGEVSKQITQLEKQIVDVLSLINVGIDFSEQNFEILSNDEILRRCSNIFLQVKQLIKSYAFGKTVKDGLKVVLFGPPNVGKSSLLNSMVGQDLAIVMETPGTTRDIVEGSFLLDGLKINLFDTAGVRQTKEPVERIGIERSYKRILDSDLVFLVFSTEIKDLEFEILEWAEKLKDKPYFVVVNKLDIATQTAWNEKLFTEKLESQLFPLRILKGSSFDKTFVEKIKIEISSFYSTLRRVENTSISITRHYELLKDVEAILLKILNENNDSTTSLSPELVSIDLLESLTKVQEILGKRFDDDVLTNIFKDFCIGK